MDAVDWRGTDVDALDTPEELADHWRSLAVQEHEKVHRLEAQLHLCEIHLRDMLAIRNG